MDELNKVDVLVSVLHEEGYRARPYEREGMSFVESGTSGYKILFSFASEGTLQMYCGIKRPEGTEISLNLVNEFNKIFRFAKMYLDDDGDLSGQADFFFDHNAPNAGEEIRQMLSLMDVIVAEMKQILASIQAVDDLSGASSEQ